MSLFFTCRRFNVAHPLVSLGSRAERPRPVILVSVTGPLGTHADDALLDPGADDTVFPDTIAVKRGIDLTNAPSSSGAGFGMHAATVRYAEVTRRVADNKEQRE